MGAFNTVLFNQQFFIIKSIGISFNAANDHTAI